ncbi:MAG: tripartite tricarboxylate transporter substrate binding protein [Burkholderiales bacterium]|nr:tripartite tricarboxylate transporter substrate binding protein [Burkholderiales bacterium]
MFLYCLVVAGAVQAADRGYPTKPVRMVVPFGAGSISDILARTISTRMSESFGQQVVVDNRPGAGGNIGSDVVAKAPPDGYTILLGAASVIAINSSLFTNMPFDQATAFAHITQVSSNTNVLVVTPSLPAKSVKELIAYGRSNPGKLTFASSGAGGSIHLSGELFKSMAGIDMVHVAYKSSPLAHVDIMSGQVQLMFDGMPTALPQVKAGKLRALGVTAGKRSAQLPELPTIAEAGLPGYEAVGWFGFAAPAGTPGEVVARLNKEIVRILNLPDVRERLLGIGAEPVGSSPEAFSKFVKVEMAKWGKIIKTLNIRLD